MRIVIITPYYPPIKDGVGDHSFFLRNELIKNGHEVFIICSSRQPIIEANHAGVYPVVERWDQAGYEAALKKLEELSPDWVVLQYVPYGYQRIGLPLRIPFFTRKIKKKGFRVLLYLHEMFIRISWNPVMIAVAILQRLIVTTMCLFADRLVVSIDFYKRALAWFTKKPIEIIPVAPNFDTSVTYNESEVAKIKQEIFSGKKIVSTYGDRDPEYIARVFSAIHAENKEIRFLYCGHVKSKAAFSGLNGIVHFTGFLPHDQVYTYLKASDIFFLADPVVGHKGGSSNKSGSLAAALYAGLPVVGIKGDLNHKEILSDTGIFLEEYHDIPSIVSRILYLSNNHVTINTEMRRERLKWQTIAQLLFPNN